MADTGWADDIALLGAVPLFPLPKVVLFPRAVLPLHIFEERYKQMTADVLEGDGLVAMALLKDGWEKDYWSRPAIEPVVCVGKIISSEKMPDGKYNFLLQGQVRARIVRELEHHPYRVAKLTRLAEERVLEIDLDQERAKLAALFDSKKLGSLPAARAMRQLMRSTLTTADLADVVAFNFLEDVEVKQELLAEADARKRVQRVLREIEQVAQLLRPAVDFEGEAGLN